MPTSGRGGNLLFMQVELRDGTQIEIRPVQPEDSGLIAAGFELLSEESRRRRFLRPLEHLDEQHLTYLTHIDHHDHEALGAIGPNDEPVGIARYVRRVDDPETADVAVVVLDAWQRRGVATELLMRLVERARENDIHRFGAVVLPDNREAVELLTAAGAKQTPDSSSGLLEFEVDLGDPDEVFGRARELLRHAALHLYSLGQGRRTEDAA